MTTCWQCGREERLCACPVFDGYRPTCRTCDDCGQRYSVLAAHTCPRIAPLWSGWLWVIPAAIVALLTAGRLLWGAL